MAALNRTSEQVGEKINSIILPPECGVYAQWCIEQQQHHIAGGIKEASNNRVSEFTGNVRT